MILPAVRRLRDSPTFKLTLGVWLGCILIQAFRVLAWRGEFPGWTAPFFVLIVITGLAFSAALSWVVWALRGQPPALRWLPIAVAALVVAILQSLVDHLIWRALLPYFGERSPDNNLDGVTLNLATYAWLYGLYAVTLELISTMQAAAEHARRAAEARALAQEARLQALRLQLNPHFLFNTLNALSSLILANRNAEADLMLAKLAAFLRTSLDAPSAGLAPLTDELAAIEAYLDIEAVRFGPAFQVDIDCAEALLGALVPSFILQPLVENAVKHAVAPADGAGLVAINVRSDGERLLIEVTDDGAVDPSTAEGAGIGLANTRDRLAVLYGAEATLTTDHGAAGFTARLRLPLRFAAPAAEAA